MYMFLGISLATQTYVNPSIDIIKKRGIVSGSSCLTKFAVRRRDTEFDAVGNEQLSR
jgi:hypothetical protein